MSDPTPTTPESFPELHSPLFKAIREIALASSPDDVVAVLRQHVLMDADFIGLIQLEFGPAGEPHSEVAAIWSRDEDAAAARGFAEKVKEAVTQEPITGVAAGHLEVTSPLKSEAETMLGASSLALFSLTGRDRTAGYLVVARKEPHLYSEEAIGSIQALTGQIAVLLDNLSLLNAVGRQVEQLALINELSQTIAGAFDLTALGTAISSRLARRLHAAYMSLALPAEQDTMQIHHLHGTAVDDRIVQAGSYLRDASTRGETVHIPDLHKTGEARAKPWLEKGIADLILVPLKGRTGSPGTLIIGAEHAGTLDKLDVMLVEQIAAQLAIALENIHLVNQLQTSLEEATTLYSTALAINAAHSLEEVYDTVMSEVAQVCQGDRVTLYLAGPDPRAKVDYLKVAAIWEDGQLSADKDGPTYTLDEAPILSQFPQTRANLTFNDLSNDKRLDKGLRAYYADKGVNALMLLPMSTGTIWLGALLIEGRHGQTFSNDHARVCRNLADQAALALDSHLLLELTRQTARNEQMVREVIEHIRRADNPNAIVEIAASDLAKIVELSPEEIKELEFHPEQIAKIDLEPEKRELIETVADQVSQAIASINLIENTQKVALREQLISGITAQLQQSVGVDDVLETAVRTLQSILKDYEITLRLTPEALEGIHKLAAESPVAEERTN